MTTRLPKSSLLSVHAMIKRQVTKRQHYVPQSFLANFTDTGKVNGRLYIMDKKTGRKRSDSPRNVAFEHYFYRGTEDVPDAVEKQYLESIDNEGINVVREIITRRALPTDDTSRDTLFQYIVRLTVGGLAIRDMIRNVLPLQYHALNGMLDTGEINENNYDAVKQMALDRKGLVLPDTCAELKQWLDKYLGSEDSAQNMFANFVAGTIDCGLLAFLFSLLRWSLVFINDESQFITSDKPACGLSGIGYFIPISPTIALRGNPKTPKPTLVGDKQCIANANAGIIEGANRFVFSREPLDTKNL